MPDAGHLGPGVDDARDRVVVDVARLAREDLGAGDPLVLGLVGQHRALDQVADRRDRRDVGPEVRRRPATLPGLRLDRHADLCQAQPLGVGAAADGDEDRVAVERSAPCRPSSRR